MTLRIQVLGPMHVWLHDEPLPLGPPAQRAVLGLLVLAGGQPVGLSDLIDAFWGDRPPASALNVVQTHVKRLRRLLEPGRAPHSRSEVLPYLGNGYRLGVPAEQLDILRFRRLVRHAADGGEVVALTEALALWQGRPFADVPLLADHPRVRPILAEHRAALGRYGAAMLAAGEVDRAIGAFEEVATADPLDEAGQARLVRAYAVAGRRAQAFSTFHAVRGRLADELGVDPGPELVVREMYDAAHRRMGVIGVRHVPDHRGAMPVPIVDQTECAPVGEPEFSPDRPRHRRNVSPAWSRVNGPRNALVSCRDAI